MQKSRSFFANLPDADRRHIFDVCSRNTYEDGLDILAKPRSEGGLEIETSVTALCRFYTSWQPDPDRALLAQDAAASNIRHQQEGSAFLGAIRADVEARILESLRRGKALADMEKDIRILKTIEGLYLRDAQFCSKDGYGGRRAYREHVKRCAEGPEFDYIPAAELASDEPSPIVDLPPLDRDILKEKLGPLQDLATLRKAAEDKRFAALESAPAKPNLAPASPSGSNRRQEAGAPNPAIGSSPVTPSVPKGAPAQKPSEIPHFAVISGPAAATQTPAPSAGSNGDNSSSAPGRSEPPRGLTP